MSPPTTVVVVVQELSPEADDVSPLPEPAPDPELSPQSLVLVAVDVD